MESTLEFYQQCVKRLLSQYESLKDEESQIKLIFDDERLRYMALWVGWHGYKRIHQCAVHIDIVGDRIAIECNDTEDPLVAELVEMGVPQDSISLNFLHPKKLEYVEQEIAEVSARKL
jgi:XisI protein